MKKILLSTITIAAFCCYSKTFGMEINTSSPVWNEASFEKGIDNQLSECSKTLTFGANLEKEKKIGLFHLDDGKNLNECFNDSERCATSCSSKQGLPKIMEKNELTVKQTETTDSVKKWRKMASLVRRGSTPQQKMCHILLKNSICQKWFGDPLYKAAFNVSDYTIYEMFEVLKTAYGKMGVSRLFKEGQNIDKDDISYFVWLGAIQDYFENQDVFNLVIGDEFPGVKQNREFLQEKCDELNKTLNSIKNRRDCLDIRQKIYTVARCEIIQDKIKRTKKEISNKQTPLQGFSSNYKMRCLDYIVDSMEDDMAEAILMNRNNSANIVTTRDPVLETELAFQSQVHNFGRLFGMCGKMTDEDKARMYDLGYELRAITSRPASIVDKQNQMNQLINENFILSLKSNAEDDDKEDSMTKDSQIQINEISKNSEKISEDDE